MKYWLKSLFWPLKTINAFMPQKGTIVDLGCGDGTVAHYLAKHGPKRFVIGIDRSQQKISNARKHQPKVKNLQFISQDIAGVSLKKASGCILSDVLHHLTPHSQTKLLKRLSRELAPNSICLIKEADKDDLIRTSLTRLWDWLLYPADTIHYYSAKQLIKIMTQLGFSVDFRPLPYFFPGSVNLFICTKK